MTRHLDDRDGHGRAAPSPGTIDHTLDPAAAAPARRLAYCSTGADTAAITVSATIIDPPIGRDRYTPIVVYAAPLHGLGRFRVRRCHWDRDLANVRELLSRGYVVAVTDGERDPLTFPAGRPAARVLLDLARAAQLPAAHAPVAIWGYGCGARAAVWAGELAAAYAPEVPLRGVVAGGVVADPADAAQACAAGPYAAVVFAGLVGLAYAYPRMQLWDTFTAAGVAAAENIERVAALCPASHEDLLGCWFRRRDPWQDPRWRRVLSCERAGAHVPKVPVHLYHGDQDTIAAPRAAAELAHTYRTGGAAVTHTVVRGAGHLGAHHRAAADALDRLALMLPAPPATRSVA